MAIQQVDLKSKRYDLCNVGINAGLVHWNLNSNVLTEKTIQLGQGVLNNDGALAVNTGKFTGRSPKDKFIVKDNLTNNLVDWGEINYPISYDIYSNLKHKMCAYLDGKEIWARNSYAGADPKYKINVTVVNTTPWANLFCRNLFIQPNEEELENFELEWLIIQIPEFEAIPEVDGTRSGNFTIINFTEKVILIGGSAYTGEMKKGIFSVLNLILPHYHNVLPMHCSANEGMNKNDVALFFGLSGTGKTTLSADANRSLIGDDEHGWTENTVFNFEGGCYAKAIDLSPEKEPEIYAAIKPGALLENICFYKGTNKVNYSDSSITENTRVAYPIDHIPNAKIPSFGGKPKNIFFLTCDAFGILPPISKLTKQQAMYHFISGYTAKVAGTEVGIIEPQTTFSACFGRVFLPLHPTKYAELLGQKLENNPEVNVWLVNTGWTGGRYGEGRRMNLKHTRAMINAAMRGELNEVEYISDNVFGLRKPTSCPNVPSEVLNPRDTWTDVDAYDKQALELAKLFVKNFEQYQDLASPELLNAAPKTTL